MTATQRASIGRKHCHCRLCSEHQRVQWIKSRGDIAEMMRLIDELESDRDNMGADLNLHACIFDGSWPSAREWADGIYRACAGRTAEPWDREVRAA